MNYVFKYDEEFLVCPEIFFNMELRAHHSVEYPILLHFSLIESHKRMPTPRDSFPVEVNVSINSP
jgi:hypothetical protein